MKTRKLAIVGNAALPAITNEEMETTTTRFISELGASMNIVMYNPSSGIKKKERKSHINGIRIVYIPFSDKGIGAVLYYMVSIIHALLFTDFILMVGITAGRLVPIIRFCTRKRILTSIEESESISNAEKIALKYAHANINSGEESEDYADIRYNILSRIIEEKADYLIKKKATVADKLMYPFLSRPYAVCECQITPEDNAHVILEAFAQLEHHTLVLIGNWTKSSYGKNLYKKYKDAANIFLLDNIRNPDDMNVIMSNAIVYVHGNSQGTYNPLMFEAMYLEVPVIAYNVMYNRAFTENKALYFRTSEDLETIIKNVKIKDYKEMGATLKVIAENKYKWSQIANSNSRLVKTKSKIPQLAFSHKALQEKGLAHLQLASFMNKN